MSDLATTYLAQARQHLAAGNTEEAIDLLKHAVVVGPPSEEVAGMIFAALAEAYQRAGRLREAAQYRKRAEALHREPTRRAVIPPPAASVSPPSRSVSSASRRLAIVSVIIIAAVFIVIAGLFWLGREGQKGSTSTSEPDQSISARSRTSVSPVTTSGRSSSPAEQENLAVLFKKVSPSAVAVFTYDRTGKPYGQASGFFVSDDGDVITNWHVLAGAWRAQVKTSKDEVFPVRHIVAEDEEADLVRISADVGSKTVISLSMSDSPLKTGERVMAIGNPLGLQGTVSDGIVSAVREFPPFGKVVQVTAAMSPGSSGGPVVNMRGEVIGVARGGISAIAGQNLNFAIPAERVSRLRIRTGKTIAEWQSAQVDVGLASAEALFRKGIVFMLAEHFDQALPCFEKAIQIKPDFADAHWFLGIAYSSIGRHSKAIAAYKTAIRIKPDDARVHYGLGMSYLMAGDRKSALEQYKLLKDLDKSLADKLFNEIYR